uniref:NADH dehydrogenase [ubiquinone] 1 alpha subcomplex assembly factor 8 n=1 Tax=Leptobrachium leishanense TaxID=445787 RepID=A0A8C5R8P1_9ANUR
ELSALRLDPEVARMCRFPPPPNLVKTLGEAASYGQCVSTETAGNNELKKSACAREFQALKECFSRALKRSIK